MKHKKPREDIAQPVAVTRRGPEAARGALPESWDRARAKASAETGDRATAKAGARAHHSKLKDTATAGDGAKARANVTTCRDGGGPRKRGRARVGGLCAAGQIKTDNATCRDGDGPRRRDRVAASGRCAAARTKAAILCARALVVALVALCVHLVATRTQIAAYAATGDDSATVNWRGPNGIWFQLDGQPAYCVDPEADAPALDTVYSGWESGSYALDYLLYHSAGGPGPEWWNQGAAIRGAFSVGQRDEHWCHYGASGDPLPEEDVPVFLDMYARCMAFEAAGGRGPERGTSRIYASPAAGKQRLTAAATGRIALTKTSAVPSVTDGQEGYSLAGAVYAIYRDEACTDEVEGARMETDASGHAVSVALGAAGPTSYWVKELSPSEGFMLDGEAHQAVVSAGDLIELTSYERPATGTLRLNKSSEGPADVATNPAYSLQGASYGIYRDAACTDEAARMTTGANGRAEAEVSAGTYWVRELVAPAGHALDSTAHRVEVTGGGATELSLADTQLLGRIHAMKSSTMPELTYLNACYVLGGTRYGIYSDASCAEGSLVSELALNHYATGSDTVDATSQELPAGDYWLRELAGAYPKGYEIDETSYKVTVRAGEVSEAGGAEGLSDVPVVAGLDALVRKVDPELDQAGVEGAQGSATLEGAIVEICFYRTYYGMLIRLPANPVKRWVLRMGPDGRIPAELSSRVSGDELYVFPGTNKPVLSFGTYTIRELQAPAGYWLDGQGPDSPAGYVAPTHLSQIYPDKTKPGGFNIVDMDWDDSIGDAVKTRGQRKLGDSVKRCGISLTKRDAETSGRAQAGASLAGIRFGVTNRSAKPIAWGGRAWAPGELIEGLELVTDAAGRAATAADALPVGTYEVGEIAANGSYRQGTGTQTVTLTEADAGRVVALAAPFENEVVRGGVKVGKVDLQNGSHAPQGAGSFEGVVMGVRLAETDSGGVAQRAAYVGGSLIQPGALATTVTLDHEGFGQTAAELLPYGTWELVELSVPRDAGYHPNPSWSLRFDVRAQGEVVDLSEGGSSVPDEVKRGDLKAVKAEESSQARLAKIPFAIVSETTGEWHVAVTDANGQLDSSSGWASRLDGRANASDAAVTRTEDGHFELTDPAALDDEAGIWFSGRTEAGLRVAPDDAVGALPYDSYRLVEIRVSAEDAAVTGGASNAGVQLAEFSCRVYRDRATVDLGTIDDQPSPSIGTFLSFGSHSQSVATGSEITLTDSVSYQNLVAGQSYVLEGELHLVEGDGSDGGVVATASRDFRADVSQGSVTVDFALDPAGLSGRSLVAFERLLCEGHELASHADLTDEGQTVSLPTIRTTLGDDEGSHEVAAVDSVRLVDVVSYRGLRPGESYELVGTLMDKESGEPIEQAGGLVSARTVFVPESVDGEAQVVFEVEGALLAGRTVVAFETLSQDGRELAIHADLEDEAQTVRLPRIGTTLVEGESGEHDAAAAELTLVDTIDYENLVEGQEYELVGTLVDRESGEVLTLSDGSEMASVSATFVPDASAGSVELSFALDARELGGRTLVAFEELYTSGRLVARHADLADEGQTLRVPQIRTSLADSADASLKEGPAASTVTLADTVLYEDVIPGKEYQLTGTLMDKESGEPVAGPEGDALSQTVSFVPEQENGSVEISFEFDASLMAGTTVVAFEELEREGRSLAVHADLSDKDQSFRFPRIGTSLADGEGSHELLAAGPIRLVDRVSFAGLQPGQPYVVTGTLMDQEDGEPLVIDATPVTSTVEFVPEAPEGEVEVVFELDASSLAGRAVVAFEQLGTQGRVVARHEDLTDEGQTVVFPRIGTAFTTEGSGQHVASPSGKLRLVDTVAYTRLVPGSEYRIVGTLMDKESGKTLTDADGAPISASATIVPKHPYGLARVVFELDASALADRSVVAFEALAHEGRTIAVHNDIDDEGQTVRFPSPTIATTLVNQRTKEHQAPSSGSVMLVDTVAYEGLIPGKEYRIEGTLMDKETGVELRVGNVALTESVTFTPDSPEGSEEVCFMLDAAQLAGRTVVAFERLLADETTLAVHADIEDRAQTVTFDRRPTPVVETPSTPKAVTPSSVPAPDQVPTPAPAPSPNPKATPTPARSPQTSDLLLPWVGMLLTAMAALAAGAALRMRDRGGRDAHKH